ncbi:MAG: hypothetical protein U0271_32350 [Polyangiaceae bacterium]
MKGPVALLLLFIVGCDKKAPPEPVLTGRPTTLQAPDEVDPNALIEGPLQAFGMKLPLRSAIERETPMMIEATMPFSFELVSSYCRERLDGGRVEIGPQRTIFSGVKIVGGDPDGLYDVVVRKKSLTATLSIQKLIGSGNVVITPDEENNDKRPRPAPLILDEDAKAPETTPAPTLTAPIRIPPSQ